MSADAKDLLLKDLELFEESLRYSEDVGEKRFSFFISLATAIGAGIVALISSASVPRQFVAPVVDLAFVSLLVVGFMTYLRMLQRNRTTDEHKGTLSYIRREYALLCTDLQNVAYRVPVINPASNLSRWARGGYAETLGLIEGLLVALYLFQAPEVPAWLAVGLGLVVAACLDITAMNRNTTRDVYFRANVGAVIADEQGRVLVLQRSGSKGKQGWQFPQGGVRDDETLESAAYREVHEETGINRDNLELIDTYPEPLVYELPPGFRKAKTGRGQVQYWLLFRLHSEMVAPYRRRGEFHASEWQSFDRAVTNAVEFRRPLYEKLKQRFESKLPPRGPGDILKATQSREEAQPLARVQHESG